MHNSNDTTVLGMFKIGLAWLVLYLGTINVTQVLTVIALVLTIIFTGFQIVKIKRDLARQSRIDALEEKLRKDDN